MKQNIFLEMDYKIISSANLRFKYIRDDKNKSRSFTGMSEEEIKTLHTSDITFSPFFLLLIKNMVDLVEWNLKESVKNKTV